MELSYTTKSDEQTIQFGKMLGRLLLPCTVIGLIGNLGAGKTCFMKGIANGISGIPESEVTSPTFTILQEYEGNIPLYHFDVYRLSGSDDLDSIGFEDYLTGSGVCVIEWADRIDAFLPEDCLRIAIDAVSENERRFFCRSSGTQHDEILKNLNSTIEKNV